MTVASLLLAPRAERRAPSQPPNPQPPSGLGPEKDLACKTAPQEPLRPDRRHCLKTSPHAGLFRDGKTQTRTGDTTIFRDPGAAPLPPKVPANRRVRHRAVQPASLRIPAVPSGFRTSQGGRGPKRGGTPAGTGRVACSRVAHIGCCEHVRVVGRASGRGTRTRLLQAAPERHDTTIGTLQVLATGWRFPRRRSPASGRWGARRRCTRT
jgi:hypothetical protein